LKSSFGQICAGKFKGKRLNASDVAQQVKSVFSLHMPDFGTVMLNARTYRLRSQLKRRSTTLRLLRRTERRELSDRCRNRRRQRGRRALEISEALGIPAEAILSERQQRLLQSQLGCVMVFPLLV